MTDLFDGGAAAESNYSAQDIQVLEGLEAVRARPGMYIGGTDEQSLLHLVAETQWTKRWPVLPTGSNCR